MHPSPNCMHSSAMWDYLSGRSRPLVIHGWGVKSHDGDPLFEIIFIYMGIVIHEWADSDSLK